MGVQELKSQAEFDQALKDAGAKLVVVDFFADWCGPCKMIAPKIAEFSDLFTDVVFYKVNVDTADDVAEKLGISAMPTFFFFKNEEKVDEVIGANESKIKETIEKNK